MKLYRYETLEALNEALADFSAKGTPIAKVKLLTEGDFSTEKVGELAQSIGKLKTVFFVLTNEGGNYQPKPDDDSAKFRAENADIEHSLNDGGDRNGAD